MKTVKYENRSESDQKMLIRISKKFAVIYAVILMFDTIFDLFQGIIDIFIDLIHIIIEFFEYSIELLLEHILNADHQQSEIMIVNFAIVVGLYCLYKFCMVLPKLFIWLKRRIKAAWLRRKRRESAYWRSLSLNRKIKIYIIYCIGIFGLLFILTL